jgi:hypothetical protein
MTYKELIAKYKLELEVMRVPFRDEIGEQWDEDARHFAYQIFYKLNGWKKETVIEGWYTQGSAHKKLPTLEEILNSLHLDIAEVSDSFGFKYWAESMGLSDDSIKALAIYEACQKEREQLEHTLGLEFINDLFECEAL